ncbi:MAG TPA: serine hydrolase domain-containing protein, partial [Candidatus Krumholzibacteria bacterium]|nr:serine hydrolase domain-containing protein [Candidatus Krumholzibacteria bacterium]
TRRRYSNSNYLLLGYVIESVTGSTYKEQLQRRIANRIGLQRTDFGGPVTPSANEARAYYFDNGYWQRQPDHAVENAGAAGGIVSTSNDLSEFICALFQGRLISAASLSEMTNGFDDGTRRSGKGLGPFSIPGAAKLGFSHDGGIGAHAALIGHVPEDSLSLALTVNGYNYPINRAFFLAWSILYGIDAPLPSFTPITLADTTALPLAGVYSAEAYGLTITVRRNGTALEAQTEGQDAFPLTYVGRNRFLFVPAGIMMDFDAPVDGVSPRFVLYQQNAAVPLTRTP